MYPAQDRADSGVYCLPLPRPASQLDHILGRPSASYKRSQVFLVVAFWSYILFRSPKAGPRALYLRRLNRYLRTFCTGYPLSDSPAAAPPDTCLSSLHLFSERFTPWQVVCATLTFVYALRHVSDLVGLGCASFHLAGFLPLRVRC